MEQAQRKALGAWYTDQSVVDFLADWAARDPNDRLIDPSCGDGRFLAAALARGAAEVCGLDLDNNAIEQCKQRFREQPEPVTLQAADFFAVSPASFRAFDAVIGNPPFVRYQRFDKHSRALALESALRVGVRLTRLTSTWAPFLLHAIQFLRPGGRLAMVVPAEITQTQYGLPTLNALLGNFATLTLVAFERNLFADAQAETYLLLADGFGGQSRSVNLVPLRDAQGLQTLTPERVGAADNEHTIELGNGARFVEAFLSGSERRAWNRIKANDRVKPIGQLGQVTNGYVSGDNDFFHRTREQAAAEGLPGTWLLPTARNARSLLGLEFTGDDIRDHERAARAMHLVVPESGLLGDEVALERFCADGEARDTHQRFKCRTRNPWWQVPGLSRPDLLLTYMTGSRPRAAVNRADALFCNSLHGLTLHRETDASTIALLFHNSLTLLSHEIEGRSYGGGILKLEPTEMATVRLPTPDNTIADINSLMHETDTLLRSGQYDQAIEGVDNATLRDHLRVSRNDILQLRGARERLLERRKHRNRRAKS